MFDGMAGGYLKRGYSLLKQGGTLVEYGNPLSLAGTLGMLGQVILFNLLPDGKKSYRIRNRAVPDQPAAFHGRLGYTLQFARSGQNQTHHLRKISYPGGGQSERTARKQAGNRQYRSVSARVTLEELLS